MRYLYRVKNDIRDAYLYCSMNFKKTNTIILAVVVLLMVCGCSQPKSITKCYDLFLTYDMYPSKETLVPIEKGFRNTVKKTKTDVVYEQGFCAEYGITLALLGKYKDAFVWLDKEITDYPVSKDYITTMKMQMIPDSVLQTLENDKKIRIEKEKAALEAKLAKEAEAQEKLRKKAEQDSLREAKQLEKQRLLEEKQAAKDSIRLEKEKAIKEKERAQKEEEKQAKERLKAEKKLEKENERKENDKIKAEKKAEKEARKAAKRAEKELEKAEKKAKKEAKQKERAEIKAEVKAYKEEEQKEIDQIKAEIKAEKEAERKAKKEAKGKK